MFQLAWDWLSANVASATLITLVALFIPVLTFFNKRKQDRISVRPLISHEINENVFPIKKGKIGGEPEITDRVIYSEWSFVISNRGQGPAKVKNCSFGLDSNTFKPLNSEEIGKALRNLFPDPNTRPQPTFTTIVPGTVIGKDQKLVVLQLTAQNPRQAVELTQVLSATNVDFVLNYSSTYDEKFVYDTRTKPTQQTRQ